MLKRFLVLTFFAVSFFLLFAFVAPHKAYAAVWPPPAVIDVDPNDPCQPACQAQRLADQLSAEDIQLGFPPQHWFVVDNGNGSYTVVCVNGEHSLTFRGGPPPPPPPPPPISCNQVCSSDNYCVSLDNAGGGGCKKCIIEPGAAQGTCKAPTPTPTPPTCGTPCTQAGECAGAALNCTSCVANKCSPPPACGTPCEQSGDCAGAALNCNACVANKCAVPPSPTPTPPSCGTPCTQSGDCAGAALNCNACVSNKCAPPPACGTSCEQAGDCVGAALNCNTCIANKCSVPPSPTPTPIPFNPASCTCDGINYSNLATGQTTTITSFAKILGADAQKGIITGQSFFLTQGADDIHGKIIAQSGLVPATLNGSHYESKWTFTLPQLVSGNTYRIWSNISCQPKTAAAFQDSLVAGVSTSEVKDSSLLGKFIAFVKGVFGVKDNSKVALAPASGPKPATNAPVASVPTGSPGVLAANTSSLQLGTVIPIEVYQKTCGFIKFRYNF